MNFNVFLIVALQTLLPFISIGFLLVAFMGICDRNEKHRDKGYVMLSLALCSSFTSSFLLTSTEENLEVILIAVIMIFAIFMSIPFITWKLLKLFRL